MKGPPLIALDTPPWVYWVEKDRAFLPAVEPLMWDLAEGKIAVVISILTLLEVLTGAFSKGDEVRARRYEQILENTRGLAVLDLSRDIAVRAARLRARHALRTPDSIHLATALVAGAAAFVTTDRRLIAVREIEVRVLAPRAEQKPPRRKR